jgi:hypothetical protein
MFFRGSLEFNSHVAHLPHEGNYGLRFELVNAQKSGNMDPRRCSRGA